MSFTVLTLISYHSALSALIGSLNDFLYKYENELRNAGRHTALLFILRATKSFWSKFFDELK